MISTTRILVFWTDQYQPAQEGLEWVFGVWVTSRESSSQWKFSDVVAGPISWLSLQRQCRFLIPWVWFTVADISRETPEIRLSHAYQPSFAPRSTVTYSALSTSTPIRKITLRQSCLVCDCDGARDERTRSRSKACFFRSTATETALYLPPDVSWSFLTFVVNPFFLLWG